MPELGATKLSIAKADTVIVRDTYKLEAQSRLFTNKDIVDVGKIKRGENGKTSLSPLNF